MAEGELHGAAPVDLDATRSLADDVLREIFAGVPDARTLLRCAAVCKRWCRLVADPSFLRCIWPENTPHVDRSSLVGFFVQRDQRRVNVLKKVTKLFPSRAPVFVPAPGSALGHGCRFLTSFVRNDAGLLDQAEPLAWHDGLLLLRTFPELARHRDPVDQNLLFLRVFPELARHRHPVDQNLLHLCVCNMLTGKCDVLPPQNLACFDKEGVRGYAILSSADHLGPDRQLRPSVGYSTFFQVFLIGVHRDDQHVYLHKFSSGAATSSAPSWSTPTKCFRRSKQNSAWNLYLQRAAAVIRGTAHWLIPAGLSSLRIIAVSAETGQASLTELPVPFDTGSECHAHLCLGMDGRLMLLRLEGGCRQEIWTQQDGGDEGDRAIWRRTHKIQLRAVPLRLFMDVSAHVVCTGDKSGAVLARYSTDPTCAYMLDSQSGEMTEVADWNRWLNYATAVPCEIDWPAFFMSRLGGRG